MWLYVSTDQESLHETPGYIQPQGSPTDARINSEQGYAEGLTDLFGSDASSMNGQRPFDAEAPKFQLFRSYIALNASHSLILVDQHRAHVRVLYERYLKQLALKRALSQTLLFPVALHLDTGQRLDFEALMDELKALGFNFELSDETVDISAIPVDTQGLQPDQLVLDLMQTALETGSDLTFGRSERLAFRMAGKAAIPYGQLLSEEEMEDLIVRLVETDEPKYSPDGKRICSWLTPEELLKRF